MTFCICISKHNLILYLVHTCVWFAINFFQLCRGVWQSRVLVVHSWAAGLCPCAPPPRRAIQGWYPLFCCLGGFSWKKPHIQHQLCWRMLCSGPNRSTLGGWDPLPPGSQEHGSIVVCSYLLCVSCEGPCSGCFSVSCKLKPPITSCSWDIAVHKARSLVLCCTELFPCL